ncbi:MAG: hypothetical protein PHT69_05940 [Bacteroidales bacterium]|nr:hypothetical protein [Bacteroidales bacterium]
MTEELKDSKVKGNTIYKIVIILLTIAVALLAWQLWVTRAKVDYIFIEKTEMERKNYDLKLELDSIIEAYNTVKNEYDSVLTEKDSIILANAEEIQKLIDSQADYRRIRRQLDHLRRVTQSYVLQIDSLHQVNAVLKEENVRIQTNFENEARRTTELTQVTEELTEKVEMASLLKAYQISAEGIRMRGDNREEVTDRARRADKIKICFTISENPIISHGPKTVYVRIAGPDNVILTKGSGDEFAFECNGQLLQFSEKKTINYEGRAEIICIYWSKTAALEKGNYSVSLFIDNYEIGQTAVELR